MHSLAALARFNSTYCMHTDVHGKGKYGQKYVLYYYDRYTYSSSIDSTTVSIRRELIYYTYMKSNKLLIIILFGEQTNHMNGY